MNGTSNECVPSAERTAGRASPSYAPTVTIAKKTPEEFDTYLEARVAIIEDYIRDEQALSQKGARKDTAIKELETALDEYEDGCDGEFGPNSEAAAELPGKIKSGSSKKTNIVAP